MIPARLHAAFAVLVALGAPCCARADDAPPITPYRPSVSSPAQLPAAGQLEVELGGLRNRGDGATRDSLPYTFKLAFDGDWGVVLGGEAAVSSREAGVRTRGVGDTTLVLKRAWADGDGDGPAYGLEFGVKLPTAKDGLGSGQADYALNLIESADHGPLHVDVNVNAMRVGAIDAGTGRTQLGLSASFSLPLTERVGATAEVSGTHRRGVDDSAQFLAALTYSPSRRLTFDIGAARAMRPSPGSTLIFGGVVFPLTRLW